MGLHASDARRLLAVLHRLRDFGNTVVVVEHDPAMIAGADFVVELGPGGGSEGGQLTYAGAPAKARCDSMAKSPGRVLLMRAIAQAAQIHQARSGESGSSARASTISPGIESRFRPGGWSA